MFAIISVYFDFVDFSLMSDVLRFCSLVLI